MSVKVVVVPETLLSIDRLVGDVPLRIRYPAIPLMSVEGFQESETVRDVTPVTVSPVGAGGGVMLIVVTVSGADGAETLPDASKAVNV